MVVDVLTGEEQNLFGELDEPNRHLGAFFVYLLKSLVTNLATLPDLPHFSFMTTHVYCSISTTCIHCLKLFRE